jgi:hypothetical protein
MAPQIPASVAQERGYVNPYANQLNGGLTDFMVWDLLEDVPDLVYPLSLNVFGKMPRDDSRTWSMLSAIYLPIRRTKFRIDQNGASDEATAHVASDLGLPIKGDNGGDPAEKTTVPRRRGRFSWNHHLREALPFLQYGHSVFEQVYRIGDDGKAHLYKLAPRPQRTIAKWNVARDGGLVSIEQDAPSAAAVGELNGVKIDVNRLVVYRNEPEPGVWIGTSLLRPSYKHWVLKNELIRIEAAVARRNGMGVPMITANTQDSEDPEKMEKLKRLAMSYRAGNSSGVALPEGTVMKLLGVSGNLPDLRLAIEYHDKQIGLAALQHFLNLDGKGGSYALASVQEDTFVQSVQTICDDLLDVANEHIVEDLIDLNYSIDESAPRIVADEIGSRQDATAAAMNMLVQSGLLTPDESLRAFIRQNLGAPPEDEGDETVPTKPAPAPVPDDDEPVVTARAPRPKPEQGELW